MIFQPDNPPDLLRRRTETVRFTEGFVAGLLVIMGLVLVPVWMSIGTQCVPDFLAQTSGPWLLPALALLWVLQQGRIDLSVWAVMDLGAVLSAMAIRAGWSPLAVMGAVAGVGLAIGVVHALAVAKLRLPSLVVTLVTGLVLVGVVMWLDQRPAQLTGGQLDGWPASGRLLFVSAGVYALMMIGRMVINWNVERPISPGMSLAGVLISSSVLSALGGVCLLVKTGQAPHSGYLVSDLRVLAGPILAGALVLRGPQRTLLGGLLLLPAMLLSTIWAQRVLARFILPAPVELNLVVLILMTLAMQWTFVRYCGAVIARRAIADRRKLLTALSLHILALFFLSVTAKRLSTRAEEVVYQLFAGALWLGGLILTVADWRKQRARPAAITQESPPTQPTPSSGNATEPNAQVAKSEDQR